jgi:serine/threonine-protein kinase
MGVVHRDVSPQNILVSTAGVAKLIDFGIAKARDRLAGDTNTGSLKGKIQYMAPEQALGANVDRRADLWAIGAILYHYLSGTPPFEGVNQLATLHRLTSGKPPLPLPATVPAPIVAIVKRALAHAPNERFATAAELQAALERAMVEAHLSTTAADVAAYFEKHLGDRAQRRRDAIDLALAAAAERARVQELLRPADPDNSSSASGVSPARAAQIVDANASSEPPAPTVGGIPPMPAGVSLRLPPPPSVPTSATLEKAAVETPVVPGMRSRAVPIAAAAIGVAGVLLGVTLTLVFRGGGGGSPAAAAGPAAAQISPTGAPGATSRPAATDPTTTSTSTAAEHGAPADTDAPTASASAASTAPPPRVPGATTSPRSATTQPTAPATTATAPKKIPKVIGDGF